MSSGDNFKGINSEDVSVDVDEENIEKMNEKQVKILHHLVEKVSESDGFLYTRSKRIAESIGLSSKEVGTNLSKISREIDSLSINKWAQSNSSTWRVESNIDEEVENEN